MVACVGPECTNVATKVGRYCPQHYKHHLAGRELRPLRKYVKGSPAERLAAWTERDDRGCLIWQGNTYRNGYGKIRVDGVNVLVHRLAYSLGKRPIPEGYEIDHLCRTRLCCEPEHLEAVPPATHRRRRTHGRDPVTGRWLPGRVDVA